MGEGRPDLICNSNAREVARRGGIEKDIYRERGRGKMVKPSDLDTLWSLPVLLV